MGNMDKILKREELDEYAWHRGYFMQDWDPNLWCRNRTELELRDAALFAFGSPIEGKSVLDVGCGAGLYVLTFLKLGASHVAGQDIALDQLSKGKAICAKNGFHPDLKEGDCTLLKFKDSTFDFVFSGDVFEHITDTQKDTALQEIFRVLKPGGVVVIKTPNLTYLKASVWVKRLLAVVRLKSPFSIFIHHTRNNPDNEHHGLIDHDGMRAIFIRNHFHEPVISWQPLKRRGVPTWLSTSLRKWQTFNEHIIMSARKPIFLGLYG